MAKDILVKTGNPDALDKIVNGFGAALVGGGMPGGYVKVDDCFVFVALAIQDSSSS